MLECLFNLCRGPQGVGKSEPGQDRNVAALRIQLHALSSLRLFLLTAAAICKLQVQKSSRILIRSKFTRS